MSRNRIAALVAAIPAPAFVSVPPHPVVVDLGPQHDPDDPTALHDVEAEVVSGPWRLHLRLNVDDWGPGAKRSLPKIEATYHGACDDVGGHEPHGQSFAFDAGADDLAALADGLREAADLLRTAPLFTAPLRVPA